MAKRISKLCHGHIDRSEVPVSAEFILDPSDPLQIITIIFRYPNGGTEWLTSREVIADIFEKGEGGIGDLRLVLKLDEIHIAIRTDDGDADVVIDGYALKSFYDTIKRVVPPPRQSVEDTVDKTLREILKRR